MSKIRRSIARFALGSYKKLKKAGCVQAHIIEQYLKCKKMIEFLKKVKCVIGWHKAKNITGFDGCSFSSLCRDCGKRLMQDSQGNWFD
jgi:hypothetical protein